MYRWPDSRTFNFSDSSYHSDPENLTYTTAITVNGTAISDSFLAEFITWDPVNYILGVAPTKNDHCGDHTFQITFDDGISVPVVETWKINLLFNLPLIDKESIANRKFIVGNPSTETFDKNFYFEDPEAMPFRAEWRQQGSSYVPYFMDWNSVTNKLTINPTIVNVGDYVMEYVGIDDAGQETVI